MTQVLKEHFPQCFDKNGDLMPHKLQEAILDLAQENNAQANTATQDLENEAAFSLSKESYSLNWLGKSYAKLLRHLPTHTLIAQDSAHNTQPQNANSKNVLIKGDNLEVLKHLKNAYYRKVKMIYIDPPYNTGNGDFIYNDERSFTPQSLAQMANIELEEASSILNLTLKNSSTHSAWLSFMYPRLYIARQLLRDDGVIFISIDDNEQANLKLLCDEIFGEDNFVNSIFVLDNLKGKSNDNFISNVGHKIIIYAKNAEFLNEKGGFSKVENIFGETIDKKYKNEDDLGLYTLNSFCKTGQGRYREDRPTMYYPILYKNDCLAMIDEKEFVEIYKDKIFNDNFVLILKDKYERLGFKFILPINQNGEKLRWTSSYNGAKTLIENGDLILNSNSIMQKKRPDAQEMFQYYASGIPKNLMYKPQYANGTDDLTNIFNGKEVFSYPKPISLLKDLLKLSTTPNSNDIILDFFAGSGTTAQAVMELNAEDKGNREFILVQLDEVIDKSKSKTAYEFCKNELGSENPTIFDITKERIKRASTKIAQNSNLDLGFKIYESRENDFDSQNGALFKEVDKNALLESFRLQDSTPLSVENQTIDLGGYKAIRAGEKLYLLNSGFEMKHLQKLISLIDAQKDFVIKEISYLNDTFESARIREIEEGIKSYSNKKGLKILVRARFA